MKVRSGHLYQRKPGGPFYVQIRIDGKTITKRLTDKDGNPTANRRDAESLKADFMQPYLVGDAVDTLKAVQVKLADRQAEVAKWEDEQNPPLSIHDAWRAYETAGNRREIADVTLRSYVSIWKAFTAWLADQHPEAERLRDVTFEICEAYKANMQRRKVTPRTFNANRAFLRSFWNVLEDKAKTTGNPWAKLAKRDETPQGRRALTVDELRAVCGSATGELRTMLAFGLYTGCRLADAACMNWGSVDMSRRMIRYLPSKTRRKVNRPLLIPMHPELFGILEEIPQAARRGPVLPDMAERYRNRGADGVSDIIQKHFEKCGLATTAKRDGAGIRRAVTVGFHSLRHSAVSLLRESGAAKSVSQAIVGHNSAEVHQFYTHTDENAMRRAVDSLPGLTLPENAAGDPLEALRGHIRELADRLDEKNWKTIKTRLMKAVDNMPYMA